MDEKPEIRLMRLMRQMRELKLAEMPLMNTDLTINQIEMMFYIFRMPGGRIQDIADGLNLTAPTVSVAVRRLEETGWLQREPDPDDGRAYSISLTEQSRTLMRRTRQTQMESLQVFLAGLNDVEQVQFCDLFERAILAAKERQLVN